MTNFSLMVSTLKQNIARAVVGKDDVVELMLTALLCEGHVLIEDVPGVGKTTLASALARSLSCSFKRIQFTPDITPSDITGFTMPSLSGDMQYRPGAIMSQIVLADEISPDTCRLWDSQTNEKLDKDRFRRDLGKVREAYEEILHRLTK